MRADVINIISFVRVEQALPFTRSGRCFDDLWGVSPQHSAMLVKRRLVFLTTWVSAGVEYSGTVIASCWEDAEEIAELRDLGEKVVGEVGDITPA